MTVIAYSSKHRVLASDSQSNWDDEDMRIGNVRKIFRLKNGALLGTAGDGDDRLVRALLAKASPRKMPSRRQLAETKTDFEGIMVFPKGQVFLITIAYSKDNSEWDGLVDYINDPVVACGHGKEFAYAAMDLGHTPQEAVRVTCKRDLTCALPVQWASLDGTEAVEPDETTKRHK
jgi:ATP-dependent protease HslVU (ClpYQ) peptidase subunit